jgi:hypothetical protein
MPRSGHICDIFLSSPGDVTEERQQAGEVTAELHSEFVSRNALALNLLRWETSTVSGIGSDPQDVVDRAIYLPYDLYIGIMWQRFGDPKGSGTEEEFNRAVSRYERGDTDIEIAFFLAKSGSQLM